MKRNIVEINLKSSSSSLIYHHHHHHRCHRHHKTPSVTTLVLCIRSLNPVSRCVAQLLVATCIICNSCSTNQTISCNLNYLQTLPIIYLKLKLTVAQQTISCNLNYPQLSDDSCHLPTKPYLDGGVGGHR